MWTVIAPNKESTPLDTLPEALAFVEERWPVPERRIADARSGDHDTYIFPVPGGLVMVDTDDRWA